MPPGASRVMSQFILYRGRLTLEEYDRARCLKNILDRISRAEGSLALSRQAQLLSDLLRDRIGLRVVNEACFSAGRDLAEAERLTIAALKRDKAGCELRQLAKQIVCFMPNVRGRPASFATEAHSVLLDYLNEDGRSQSYTYDDRDRMGDFIDTATIATRRALSEPDFDPRPAVRRRKKETTAKI